MIEMQDDGVFSHDEADVIMISYVLQAAIHGKDVIRVLSDDTDVFVWSIGCIRQDCNDGAVGWNSVRYQHHLC